MATLAEQVQGERMARIALSMIAEPNDPTTGYVLARHGGIETLRLIESNDEVPGLARADMLMWRERLTARVMPGLLVSCVISSLTVWDDGACHHQLWRSPMRIG